MHAHGLSLGIFEDGRTFPRHIDLKENGAKDAIQHSPGSPGHLGRVDIPVFCGCTDLVESFRKLSLNHLVPCPTAQI